MDHYISFNNISKSYGDHKVIDKLEFGVSEGEFVSLLGPSGSGKTTLLMLLAGFEQLSAGEIHVNGERIDHLPPHKRNMGVVFQNYALFPHLSIAQNIAFPLRCRRLPAKEISERTAHVLDMVKLSHLADRRPVQLSGGQQQRIALARALVFEPKIVLMDEPLGALDKQLREHMQMEIRALHQKLGLTIVFVTHDQTEALTISDRVAVFNAGEIEQVGSPKQIYTRPQTRFVADFIGQTNLLPVKIDQSAASTGLLRLACGQILELPDVQSDPSGAELLISVRPESLLIDHPLDNTVSIDATVSDVVFQGEQTRLHMNYQGSNLIARLTNHAESIQIGQSVKVSFAPNDCVLLCQS